MGEPAPEPTPTPAPAPPPAPPAPDAPSPAPDDGKGGKDSVLADLAKERDKRQALESKVSELQTAQQSQLDAIAKALGLKQDDTPPDPAALAAQVTAEQTRAREAAVQLAVYRSAAAAGGNPDALLDSASFLAAVKAVDPADVAAVAAAVKEAVAANPRLAADPGIPPAGHAGIGVVGGGGGPIDPRLADLAQIQADLAASKRG